MTTTLALLRDLTLPAGFRLMIADLALRGRRYSPLSLAGAVEGWNAAMAAGGAEHLRIRRPDLLRQLLTVPLGTTIHTITPHGRHFRDEPKVLQPQWREAVQRGEQIPQDQGEVFATHAVTERFVPFPVEPPVPGDPQVADQSGRVHPAEDEVDVIGGGGHGAHPTPAAPAASTLFRSTPKPAAMTCTVIMHGTDPETITLTAYRPLCWTPGLLPETTHRTDHVPDHTGRAARTVASANISTIPALFPPARRATAPARHGATNPPAAIAAEFPWEPEVRETGAPSFLTPFHETAPAAVTLRLSAGKTVPWRHCPACGAPVRWRRTQKWSHRSGELTPYADYEACGVEPQEMMDAFPDWQCWTCMLCGSFPAMRTPHPSHRQSDSSAHPITAAPAGSIHFPPVNQ